MAASELLLKFLAANRTPESMAVKLAKRQAELDELQRAAGKRFDLEQSANSFFSQPGVSPEGPLTLLHGSPHKFDRFDFENNMLKGEGAMSYGPGGYMTGNDPLAEEYARVLFAKHMNGGDVLGAHKALRTAAAKNPLEIAEFLRARNVAKGLVEKLDTNTEGSGLRSMKLLPPHMQGLFEPQTYIKNWQPGVAPDPQYVFKNRGRADDFAPYREAMRESGLSPSVIAELGTTGRVGRGGLQPQQAVNIGSALRNIIEKSYGGAELRPRISERLEYLPQNEVDAISRRSAGAPFNPHYSTQTMDYYDGPSALRTADSALRKNLNSTWRAANERPGNKRVQVSMARGNRGRRFRSRDAREVPSCSGGPRSSGARPSRVQRAV